LLVFPAATLAVREAVVVGVLVEGAIVWCRWWWCVYVCMWVCVVLVVLVLLVLLMLLMDSSDKTPYALLLVLL
jgi:hypothetical protein